MPELRRAWACSHGCGRAVLTSKSRMAEHERGCFDNPDVRACKTCKFDKCEIDDNGCTGHDLESWQIRYCEIDKLPDDKMATRNCFYWKSDHITTREAT